MSPVASNKKVKKLARARQRETGERYTVALAYVRRQELTMSKKDQLKTRIEELMAGHSGEEAPGADDYFPVFPVPLWPSRVAHGNIAVISKNSMIKIEPGETHTLLSGLVDGAIKLEIVALSVQAMTPDGLGGLQDVLVSNLRVVRAGDGSDGSGEDLLPLETNRTAFIPWREAIRYEAVGGPWAPLAGEPAVLGSADRVRLDLRYSGAVPIYVAVSVMMKMLSSFTLALYSDSDFRKESFDEASEVNDFAKPWMRRLEPHGRIRMGSMQAGDEKGFSVNGGSGAVGDGITMSWRPNKSCVLHGLMFQAIQGAVGTVVVLQDLQVFRHGKPRTPTLLSTPDDFQLADDHSDVSALSMLRGTPILIPGDEVRVEVAAFASSGERASGKVSVLTHQNFSQAGLSSLLDHLAKDEPA